MDKFPSKFYHDNKWEDRYRRKVQLYRKEIEEQHPEFNWIFDGYQIMEMCRAEIELERADAKIANDLDKNFDLIGYRKKVQDSLFRYRKTLCVSIEMRKRYAAAEKKLTGQAAFLAGLENSEMTP